jgi:hypothetical protein
MIVYCAYIYLRYMCVCTVVDVCPVKRRRPHILSADLASRPLSSFHSCSNRTIAAFANQSLTAAAESNSTRTMVSLIGRVRASSIAERIVDARRARVTLIVAFTFGGILMVMRANLRIDKAEQARQARVAIVKQEIARAHQAEAAPATNAATRA